MGFLDKITGKDEAAPMEIKEPSPDPNPGPKMAFEPSITSFPVTVELRIRSSQYERLTGPWVAYQLTRIEDYYGAKKNLLGNFRVHYGFFKTTSGKQVARWNQRTWDNLIPMLGIDKK